MGSAKDVVRKIEEAWGRDDLAALDELVAADIKNHDAPPGFPPGLEGAKFGHRMFMASFPDRRQVIEDILEDGDKVTVRSVATGTHTGEAFLGIPAGGRQVRVEAISIYRVSGGRAVEHWGINDGVGLFMQLGGFPQPAPA
jgi:predicted ester cyclase